MVVGVDIGGSHITAALVDMKEQAILPETLVRERINSHGDVEEVIGNWAKALEKVIAKAPSPVKFGIAMPGPFDYEAGISLMKDQDKYQALYGINVKNLLAERLGVASEAISFANDASCFLSGEVFGGAAKGAKSALGLTLGTGLGSARYRNGITEDANLWCHPYKDSVAEDYISTRALVNRYHALSGRNVDDVKALAHLYEVDAHARTVFHGFPDDLAIFLAGHITQDTPEVIVIGGNIANAWNLFIPATVAKLAEFGIEVPVKRALLGESAALVGGASLWA